MKRNTKNRKGFTLVELLVVIAILAILATVSIVGYTNFINKANRSADEAAVTQMNTALQANEINEGAGIQEAFKVLKECGMTAEDYHPLTSNTYFFWDSSLNRIMYAEYANETYTVLSPVDYENETYSKSAQSSKLEGHQWYSLSGTVDTSKSAITAISTNEMPTISDSSSFQSATAGVYKKVEDKSSDTTAQSNGTAKTETYTCVVKSAEDLIAASDLISESAFNNPTINKNTGYSYLNVAGNSSNNYGIEYNVNIILPAGTIDLMGADTCFLNTDWSSTVNTGEHRSPINVTFTGGGGDSNSTTTIKGLYISKDHAVLGQGSEGKAGYYGAALFYCVQDLTVKNITIDGATVGDESLGKTAIFAAEVRGSATFENVQVLNSTVYGKNKTGLLVGYATNKQFTDTDKTKCSEGTGDYKITLKGVTVNNSSVYVKEGEGALLVGTFSKNGYASASPTTNIFTVEGTNSWDLTTNNNKVAFVSSAVTKTENGHTFGKKSGEDAYRVGLANIAWVLSNTANTSLKCGTKNDYKFYQVNALTATK